MPRVYFLECHSKLFQWFFSRLLQKLLVRIIKGFFAKFSLCFLPKNFQKLLLWFSMQPYSDLSLGLSRFFYKTTSKIYSRVSLKFLKRIFWAFLSGFFGNYCGNISKDFSSYSFSNCKTDFSAELKKTNSRGICLATSRHELSLVFQQRFPKGFFCLCEELFIGQIHE